MKQLLQASLLAAAAALSAAAQTPTHEYRLDNSLADTYGGPSLVANGGTLSAAGYAFGANQGLTLSNVFSSGAQANSPYTIALHYSLANTNGFAQIIDFANGSTHCVRGGTDYGSCGLFNGDWVHSNQPLFYPNAYGQEGTYTDNVEAWTVITRSSIGTVRLYVNGAFELSDNDNAHEFAVFGGANNIARFFESAVFPESAGFVDYIGVWDQALSQNEVQGIQEQVDTAPEPASLALLLTGLGAIAAGARVTRRKRMAP